MDDDFINLEKYLTIAPGIRPHTSKILIIDDEEPGVRLLERILKRAQFENVTTTTDPRKAASLFQQFQPDLVLTDLLMPHLDGLVVIRQLRELISSAEYLPIVVLTADVTKETKRQALAAGATDFLIKPFDIIEALLRIGNLLQARLAHLKIREQNATLEENVRLRTLDLEQTLLELTASQQKVIQQERLAALGTMASRIAQEFNDSLALVISFAEGLLRDAREGLSKEQAAIPIAEILTAARNAAKIVKRLREFSRDGQNHEFRLPVDLNDLIQDAVALTKPIWKMASAAGGTKINLSVDFGEIPTVDGDATELREALTSLILNAITAMPHGGSVMLRTRAKNDTVLVQVSDTGAGMNEEARLRCLEPFSTGKDQGGTDLGLDLVFASVRRHQGVIDVQSQPGKGTTFNLLLPAAT